MNTFLDLFCGAGGLSLGLINAGFAPLLAVDNTPAAVQTYTANIGAHTAAYDLAQPVALPHATVIVGGPPCQGFSSAGLRRSSDQRNSLVHRFVQIVIEMRPQAFLFENVEGFLTADQGTQVVAFLAPLIEAGYRIHLRKINAANFGVPQHRKRVIALGGLGWSPSFPTPTHSAFGAPGAARAVRGLPPTPTLADALHDLPPAALAAPGTPPGHIARPLRGIDLQRALALRPGQTMRDLPEDLQHASFRRRAARRVMDGTPTERRGGAPAGVKRLRPDEPSKAITGGALAEFIHPFEQRPLTIRECARLQTFPDTFAFFGSVAEQMQLVGNSVPPLLSAIIARQLLQDLVNADIQHDCGALLSFVPTVADGVSPALKRVMQRVEQMCMQESVLQEHLAWMFTAQAACGARRAA